MKSKLIHGKRAALACFALAIAVSGAACNKNDALLPGTTQQALLPAVTDPFLMNEPYAADRYGTYDRANDGLQDSLTEFDLMAGPTPLPTTRTSAIPTIPGRSEDVDLAVIEKVKKVAIEQPDVKNAAVVVTHDGNVLVALELRKNNVALSDKSTTAIMKAAKTRGVARITTDPAHYATIKALEFTANGAAVTADRIRDIWNGL